MDSYGGDYMRENNKSLNELQYDQNDPDRFKDENLYKYHENTKPYDASIQPFSYFYVTVCGQIEFGEFLSLDGLAIQYHFVAGVDWNMAGGLEKGAGQHSFKGAAQKGVKQKLVWNLPFEITYRSMTPYGWPQIVLYCTEKDSEG